jgi:hypothetical protein
MEKLLSLGVLSQFFVTLTLSGSAPCVALLTSPRPNLRWSFSKMQYAQRYSGAMAGRPRI